MKFGVLAAADTARDSVVPGIQKHSRGATAVASRGRVGHSATRALDALVGSVAEGVPVGVVRDGPSESPLIPG